MAVSKAQQRAVNKYVKSNYDEVKLRMPKGKRMSFRHMQRSRGNPSMPISTVLLMRPCNGMILQLKCNRCKKPAQDFPVPASYIYYLSSFFK